ncbi:LacI family DNA-binding transcriptional regulator [Pantoea sp. BAV 3049]|uniref:LacI family DNA-binding transcriptional regulator n=1 Tax=Pantoea sp. BAV 3049 TaxID=2654188 RepID=UPI00131B197F|nr:LacI family DNA-binding transcriptional regulator [Pantoea sp. BAV 3049]
MSRQNDNPPSRRPTINDIAEKCGLSRATVARALSGKGYVKPQRKALIHETAAGMGYRISTIARALRTQKTATVGVLIADITNPIFPEIVKGIDEVLTAAGNTLFLCNTDENQQKQQNIVRSLLERQVDGLILVSQSISEETLALLQDGPPCVFVNRQPEQLPGDYIGPDNDQGVRQLLEHLYGLGHRRIAYMGGPQTSSTARERQRCFQREMQRLGCKIPPTFIIEGSYHSDSGRSGAAALLACDLPPTAILAANDFVALDTIAFLHQRGMRVPEDISVTGFDDTFKPAFDGLNALRNQGLTSIDQPKRELGRLAGEALLKRIANPLLPVSEKILPTTLKVRETTGPAKK